MKLQMNVCHPMFDVCNQNSSCVSFLGCECTPMYGNGVSREALTIVTPLKRNINMLFHQSIENAEAMRRCVCVWVWLWGPHSAMVWFHTHRVQQKQVNHRKFMVCIFYPYCACNHGMNGITAVCRVHRVACSPHVTMRFYICIHIKYCRHYEYTLTHICIAVRSSYVI